MFDSMLIKHCSPTLAGLKPAGLFNFQFSSDAEAQKTVCLWNGELNAKGIYIRILKLNSSRALIYVYRRRLLEKLLSDARIRQFLTPYGYESLSVSDALFLLEKRVEACLTFPHEIGVFLGYPLGDVIGFIKNSGRNCKCCGCWKVYCNEREALKTFALYEKCRLAYEKLFHDGSPVAQLAVAV